MLEQFGLGDTVKMKKTHPCGSDAWQIIRTGADVKIKCCGCGRIIMLPRPEFVRKAARIIKVAEETNGTDD